jgi:hypothetical protein
VPQCTKFLIGAKCDFDLDHIGLRYLQLIGNRFWPSGALVRSVKPKSVRFHGRRVRKVGPESQIRAFGFGARPESENTAAGGLGAAEQGIRSPEQINLHGTLRRLMNVGGFFCALSMNSMKNRVH